MTAFYNEIDPYAAQWLRNLIAAGHIAAGDVDERSITEVRPDDLRNYKQCHFFAGIGGWSYALRLAGWPDERPVWTGSCPCQPFSSAGKQRGSEDERHLWPAFFDLIRECRPGAVFGEQVAGAAGYAWWDHVAADLEGEGYAAAAADIGAHSVGAPHLRQRLYWLAHAECWPAERHGQPLAGATRGDKSKKEKRQRLWVDTWDGGDSGRLADANMPDEKRQRPFGVPMESKQETKRPGAFNPWAGAVFIGCSDGKARPTQPGLFPLAHGVSGRVGRLRAYGNAIVPQVAATFIAAYLAVREA